MIEQFMDRWGETAFIISVILITVMMALEFAKLRVEVTRMQRFIVNDYKERMKKESERNEKV